jgi:dimethylamine/trimethylamine dehydrogenase
VLRNRFYAVPHCTGYGVEKPWTQARFRATKAEGGWAAVCTEYCAISFDADEMPAVAARLWDNDDARSLSLMCDEVHEHGALAGVELHHSGAHGPMSETRWAAVAPSQLASDLYPLVVPKAMERDDILRVQTDWVAAARLARTAGFDIVYVYGGHSYLPTQFLSPFYNRRTDEYGGTLENRARFWLETLERVREAVGDDCAIAARVSVDALGPAGVELDEALAVVGLAHELVDLGRERWLDRRVVEGLRCVAVFPRGLPARMDGPGARCDGEADRRGRQAHESRPDGRDRPERSVGPDRRGPPLDR